MVFYNNIFIFLPPGRIGYTTRFACSNNKFTVLNPVQPFSKIEYYFENEVPEWSASELFGQLLIVNKL